MGKAKRASAGGKSDNLHAAFAGPGKDVRATEVRGGGSLPITSGAARASESYPDIGYLIEPNSKNLDGRGEINCGV